MKDNKEHLDKLVKDLFRLGDYSAWIPPKMDENTTWFKDNKLKFDDGEGVSLRLNELCLLGADLSDKIYLISNVNKIEPIKFALENGGNPNIPGKNGILPIDRAFDRGRTKIAEAIIKHKDFNFITQNDKNILFLCISHGKYKLATDLIKIKPEFIFEKDKDGKSIFYRLSEHLIKNKINSKTYTLINNIYDIHINKKIDINSNESHNGKNIFHNSEELGTFLKEKEVLNLQNILNQKEEIGNNNQALKAKI